MTASPFGDIYWPLDPSLIGQFSDPKDFGQLAAPLRDSIWTMRRDCHAVTGGWLYCNSGYRTPWMQWLLRHGRVKGHEFDARYPASPRTALPGSSNHQRRLACDLGGTQAMLGWCNRNSHRYGLTFPVPGEDWHVERRLTPTVPLITYDGGPTYDRPAPPPHPTPLPKPQEIDMAMPCFREKETGHVLAVGLGIDGPYAYHIPGPDEYAVEMLAGTINRVPLADVPTVPAAALKRYRRK